jgi:hypothetical protein
MRKVKIYIQFIISTIIFYSCSNDHSIIKLESEIINDIFLQTFPDDYCFPVFPPPPPSKRIGEPLRQEDSLLIKKYKDLIAKIDQKSYVYSIEDSTRLSIDSVRIADYLTTIGINNCFEKFHLDKNNIKSEIPIDINQIKDTGKFKLIKRSEILPKGFNFLKPINVNLTYNYFGNLIFSKPYLDDSGKNGFLVCVLECGFECDREFILLIEKQKDKWILKNKR